MVRYPGHRLIPTARGGINIVYDVIGADRGLAGQKCELIFPTTMRRCSVDLGFLAIFFLVDMKHLRT